MNRRTAISTFFLSVAGAALGLVGASGARAEGGGAKGPGVMGGARRFARVDLHEGYDVSVPASSIKAGNVFLVFDPDGSAVCDEATGSPVWRATGDAFVNDTGIDVIEVEPDMSVKYGIWRLRVQEWRQRQGI